MAIVTRFSGDAKGVVYVDRSRADAGAAQIISTGVGKHPTAFKITAAGADFALEMGVNGAVESVLRAIQIASTTIAYQVDADQISVIVEATGFDDAALTAAIHAVGVVGTVNLATAVVTSAGGLKLA